MRYLVMVNLVMLVVNALVIVWTLRAIRTNRAILGHWEETEAIFGDDLLPVENTVYVFDEYRRHDEQRRR